MRYNHSCEGHTPKELWSTSLYAMFVASPYELYMSVIAMYWYSGVVCGMRIGTV